MRNFIKWYASVAEDLRGQIRFGLVVIAIAAVVAGVFTCAVNPIKGIGFFVIGIVSLVLGIVLDLAADKYLEEHQEGVNDK